MSDLFKRHRPRLSEDEERALWERVRTIPRGAGGRRSAAAPRRRSPWEALWARPAVRYGAPALAVALVAVLFVTERRPVPPVREEGLRRAVPADERVAVGRGEDVPATPAPAPEPGEVPPATTAPRAEVGRAPAPAPAAGSRFRAAAPPASAPTMAESQDAAEGSREVREEALSARGTAGTAGTTSGGSTFAPPPPSAAVPQAQKERAAAPAEPQGVREFIREDPRVGSIRAAGEPDRVSELRAVRGTRTNVSLIGTRILVEVLIPVRGETFAETVPLPISGGTARIAAGTTAGALEVEGASLADLVRIAGREGASDAPNRRQVDLVAPDGSAGAAALVAPDRRPLRSRFVSAAGDERVLAGSRPGARSRAAGLAAELILAVAENDAVTVTRVREAAHRLAEERPNDRAARALAAWSDDARAAFGSR